MHCPSTHRWHGIPRGSNNGADWTTSHAAFTYLVPPPSQDVVKKNTSNDVPIPRVRNWGPPRGPRGTLVEVHGENFLDAPSLKCRFDDIIVPAKFISKTSIKCRSPPHDVGSVFLEVSNNGLNFSNNQATYTYEVEKEDIPPLLKEITPSQGAIGTTVSFLGKDFKKSESLACRFGGVVVKATFVTEGIAICTTPSHPFGPQKVSISNNGYTWSTELVMFTYIEEKSTQVPHINSIEPTEGPVGSFITVLGTGFKNGESLSCRFGSVRVPANYVTSTKVTCFAPPRFPGPIFLEVSNNGKDFSDDEKVFLISAGNIVPSLFVVDPKSGADGIPLSIHGKDFEQTPDIQCRFGESTIVLAKFHSNTHIVCNAPAGLSGTVLVEASNDGKRFSKNKVYFTFDSGKPVVLKIYPLSGPGGVMVTVTGREFDKKKNHSCLFGSHVTPAIVSSPTILLCKSPTNVKGSVHLQVSDGVAESNELIFTFKGTPTPHVLDLHPSSGLEGSYVNVFGRDFENTTTLQCKFGGVLSAAKFFSSSIISCLVPPLEDQMQRTVYLEATNDGSNYSTNRKMFVYLHAGMSFATWIVLVSVAILLVAFLALYLTMKSLAKFSRKSRD